MTINPRIVDPMLGPNRVLSLPLYKPDGASFMSKDNHGYLCTVFGALWRPDGRYFDGTNDKISIPHATSLTLTSELTIWGWMKWLGAPSGNYPALLNKGTSGTKINYGAQFELLTREFEWIEYNTGWGTRPSGLFVKDNAFSFVSVAVHEANKTCNFVVDGVARNVGKSATQALVASTSALEIARNTNLNTFLNAVVGELHLEARALTFPETLYNMQATKWRYV